MGIGIREWRIEDKAALAQGLNNRNVLDILRIFAEPFAFNVASCRVLEKAGFTCEGTLRCNAFKNGRTEDMKMYALLKD
jgi:RimJ/RimL family protein N-acetyltransferase